MVELKIDPEFRDKIPPLTEAEFEQLKENILSDGEVYEPIATWNGTIIDGHNRWKVIQEHPEIPYRTKEMDFADKWAAFEWMYKKQLGRRNLTNEQKTYMVGKMYEARKQSQGGNHGTTIDPETGRFTANGQNVQLRDKREIKDGTAGEIGKEIGVDGRTVRRAEKFAKGIDTLRENNPEAAEAVLQGNSGATKSEISELSAKTEQEIQKVAEKILTGEIKKPKESNNKRGFTKDDRASRAETEKIVADMYDVSTVPEFTLDLLIDDIQLNAKNYVDLLRNTLTDRSTLLTPENKPKVAEAITTYVIKEIEKVRSLLE